jgi:hypothetical protein
VQRPAGRPPLEVADILRAHGEGYRRDHQVSSRQETVMRHLVACRTAALGGHVDRCTSCDGIRISYNSCRDRHCPKCQSLGKAEWLEARREHLLPIPYWHLVFTLPSTLHPLALQNKRVVFDLLFDTAAATLRTLARDPKHLGAEIGFTAVLHTWGQNLHFHPHLHCVVTGGGLRSGDGCWISVRKSFFLPVKVLGRLFRGKFLHALGQARLQGKLRGEAAALDRRSDWKQLLDHLYQLDWVVYAKPPFGGPEHVFRYLGRYTHRVAIANHRLVALEDGRVTFRLKDYADGGRKKRLTLTAGEFIRRFLLHVLPRRFVRIRHYGLLASRNVHTRLVRARQRLAPESKTDARGPRPDAHASTPWWKRLLRLTGIDVMRCPFCNDGRLVRIPAALPARSPP